MKKFEEILDLVDHNDCVIKTIPLSLAYQQNLCSQIRSVWLIIKNDEGKLWIPRRSFNVERLPGYLDGSVAGHVRSGETYEQALLREVQEEIGYNLQFHEYRLLGKLTPNEHKSFSFASVYEYVTKQAPENWNRHDIGEWYWMSPQEIIDRCQNGEKAKSILPLIIEYFYK